MSRVHRFLEDLRVIDEITMRLRRDAHVVSFPNYCASAESHPSDQRNLLIFKSISSCTVQNTCMESTSAKFGSTPPRVINRHPRSECPMTCRKNTPLSCVVQPIVPMLEAAWDTQSTHSQRYSLYKIFLPSLESDDTSPSFPVLVVDGTVRARTQAKAVSFA